MLVLSLQSMCTRRKQNAYIRNFLWIDLTFSFDFYFFSFAFVKSLEQFCCYGFHKIPCDQPDEFAITFVSILHQLNRNSFTLFIETQSNSFQNARVFFILCMCKRVNRVSFSSEWLYFTKQLPHFTHRFVSLLLSFSTMMLFSISRHALHLLVYLFTIMACLCRSRQQFVVTHGLEPVTVFVEML